MVIHRMVMAPILVVAALGFRVRVRSRHGASVVDFPASRAKMWGENHLEHVE